MIESLTTTGVILGVVLGLMSIYKFFWKSPSEKKTNTATSESITTRFISMFENHGVHRNQIPEFFEHNLTLHQCSSNDELSKVLTPEILIDAAKRFAVNIEWLQGASKEIYPVHKFYKNPKGCELFIEKLKSNGNELGGYLINSDASKTHNEDDAVIVITEEIGIVNNRIIERLHILGGWIFSYWKSRAYLTACASIALNKEVWLLGRHADQKWLSKFSQGYLLPTYDFESSDLNFAVSGHWDVDMLIELPEKYLKGVDPERDNFGINAAISKWLDLEADGYMFIKRFNNCDEVRACFENYNS